MNVSEHYSLYQEYASANPWTFEELTTGSHKKALWTCDTGHQWYATVANRVRRGSGCPVCARSNFKKSVKTPLSEELSKELVVRQKVSANSHKKILWRCAQGHEWSASPANRTKGKGCPYCSGRLATPENSLAGIHPDVLSRWSLNNQAHPTTVTKSSGQKMLWICAEHGDYESRVSDVTRVDKKAGGCPRCQARVSSQESELFEFVQNLCLDAVQSNRTLIGPKEVDIYIPSQALAIEFNGLYWHTESKVGRSYHREKWQACQDQGVQLITIWSDEYASRPDVVKAMIASKLGAQSKSVGGKHTILSEIPFTESKVFLDRHHIQGGVRGTKYLGLYVGNTLVASGVFTKYDGHWTLDRYGSSQRVHGGLSKMMAVIPTERFITFADLCVSTGEMYERGGWQNSKTLPQDYSYLINNKRVHKFNLRKPRFKSHPALLFEEGMTERELAALNGIERIYDCGKKRYEYYR